MIFATVGTFDYQLFEAFPYLMYTPQFGSIFNGGLVDYPWMAKVISIAALVGLLTTMLVLMALNSRALEADQHLHPSHWYYRWRFYTSYNLPYGSFCTRLCFGCFLLYCGNLFRCMLREIHESLPEG